MKKAILSLATLVSSVLSVSAHAATFEQASMKCANTIQAQLTPNQSRAWGNEMLVACQNGIKTARDESAAEQILRQLESARVEAMNQSKLTQATELDFGGKFFALGLVLGGMSQAQVGAIASRISGQAVTTAPAAPAATSAPAGGKMTCDAVVYDTNGDGPARKLQDYKNAATVTFHTDQTATVVVPFKDGSDYDGKPHSFETMALNRLATEDDDKPSIKGDGDSFAFTPVGQNWDIVLENCHS
ncbi:hypothetical protein QMM96_22230 [Citrobacter freundii]|uniref:hypothetical protein n=1 Tax=Citrobacter freundii TaxID=546 RepID=UPI002B243C74|nr:hypothetical protein [Citrobacter freundii]MEB2478150.1 hypothetical protein [Citrobacter freundii]